MLYRHLTNKIVRDDVARNAEKEAALLNKTAELDRNTRKSREDPGIIVSGAENLMIRVARCCSPVPGDEIVGFITKGRGITVHRRDCPNIRSLSAEEQARFIEVQWEDRGSSKSYVTDVVIEANDRKGLLSDISRTCDELGVDIEGLNGKKTKDGGIRIELTLMITGTTQMQHIRRSLQNVQGVINVYRKSI